MIFSKKIFNTTSQLAIIFIIFAAIFCSISLVNHYQFRTASQDLGMNSHALFSYAHFSINYYTLSVGGSEMNYLADHFSPITMLYVPFYYLFGSYALLILQILAILFGGLGIYKYARLYFTDGSIPLIILIQFFGIWGIYSALSFDFHNNVIAAMLVPWLLLHYEKKEKQMFLLYFFLILISKENMALWLVFILLGLVLKQKRWKAKESLKFELPLLIFTLVYFAIIVGIVMPYLRDGAGHSQLARYSHLGDSIPEVLGNIIHKPLYFILLFFKNPLNKPFLDGIKTELHLMVIISGGFAFLFSPRYLIMLLPIYAQKMLTNNFEFWGINYQYSIEFAPIISIALIEFIYKLRSVNWKIIVAVIVALITHIANINTINHRKSLWYNSTNTVFYQCKHYASQLNLREIYKQIRKLPNDAILSVSTNLSSHLANRQTIYTFPNVKNAQYIVLFTDKRTYYPLKKEDFEILVNDIKNSGEFITEYDMNDLLILKRK